MADLRAKMGEHRSYALANPAAYGLLPAARTVAAWAHGFIGMTLAGSFRLGGDVKDAWAFGLESVLEAIRPR